MKRYICTLLLLGQPIHGAITIGAPSSNSSSSSTTTPSTSTTPASSTSITSTGSTPITPPPTTTNTSSSSSTPTSTTSSNSNSSSPSTSTSSPTESSTKVTMTLPKIYIKNASETDTALNGFTILFSYTNSNETYSAQATSTVNLPAGKTTEFQTSMQTPGKTPVFRNVYSIEIGGQTIKVKSRIHGIDPLQPIAITQNGSSWELVDEDNTPTTGPSVVTTTTEES